MMYIATYSLVFHHMKLLRQQAYTKNITRYLKDNQTDKQSNEHIYMYIQCRYVHVRGTCTRAHDWKVKERVIVVLFTVLNYCAFSSLVEKGAVISHRSVYNFSLPFFEQAVSV